MTPQTSNDTKLLDITTTFDSVPPDYSLVDVSRVTKDERPVRVFRYERTDGRSAGFGGEHVSFVGGNSTLPPCSGHS